jgi:hypothetical protein
MEGPKAFLARIDAGRASGGGAGTGMEGEADAAGEAGAVAAGAAAGEAPGGATAAGAALPPPGAREILRYAGGYYRFLFLGLSALMIAAALRRDPARAYSRELDMRGLLENNARGFPCLRPLLKTGPITLKHPVRGGWALARSPILFCAERRLIKTHGEKPFGEEDLVDLETGLGLPDSPALGLPLNTLNGGGAAWHFSLQLGPAFGARPRDLPVWQEALALAFTCHSLDLKGECHGLLDLLSDTWDPKLLDASWDPAAAWARRAREAALWVGKTVIHKPLAPPPWPGPAPKAAAELAAKVADARKAIARAGGDEAPGLALHGAYVNVWLTHLLSLARRKGVLPSSLWIWLKPTDRSLFYALNQLGGRCAWIEAAGVWSHHMSEARAGKALEEPAVVPAVDALVAALQKEGWLPLKHPRGFGWLSGLGDGLRRHPPWAKDKDKDGEDGEDVEDGEDIEDGEDGEDGEGLEGYEEDAEGEMAAEGKRGAEGAKGAEGERGAGDGPRTPYTIEALIAALDGSGAKELPRLDASEL